MRVLANLGLADEDGVTDPAISVLQLNVIYPLCDEQIIDFIKDKREVLLVEEGQPDLMEQQIRAMLHQRGIATPFHGHDLIPGVGELVPGRRVAGAGAVHGPPAAGPRRGHRRHRQRLRGAPEAGRDAVPQAGHAAPADLLHRLPGAARCSA